MHRSLLVPLRAALCALGALAGAEGATAFGAEVDDESADHAPEERWDARVAVTAELPESKSAPLGAASTVLDPTADNVTPSNLTDLVVDAPAVSQNGQGGHFQVFSIRGVSRHRVTNLISGMRVGSERRAGASVSFVDPLLMGSVEVQRGPSTTLFGSGALGGVVQVFPRTYEGWELRTGYESTGDENYQVLGYGSHGWSLGLARRDAGDATAADGTLLDSHFTQYSATLAREWSGGPRRYRVLFVPALAEDIGKANTDFPERTTDYPLERHQMLELSVESESAWRFQSWVHAQDLETEVHEGGDRAQVVNESVDYGASWERRHEPDAGPVVSWGLQAFGRHGVDAEETGQPPSLDGAREIELGLFTTLHWRRPATEYEIGVRLSGQEQRNAGFPEEDLEALDGFVGILHHFGERVRLRGSVSSGLRYPNLSERFYTGTTGAGTVVGNPGLDPERSLNGELSLRWVGRHALIDTAAFRNRIDDYIERVEPVPDVRTYTNLTGGTLQGVELQVVVLPCESWSIGLGGHAVRGRDDDGNALADVPPHRIWTEASYRGQAWSFSTRLTHRLPKTDPDPAELRREAADELRASISYGFAGRWSVALTGENLLDEEYFLSADDKAPPAPERSFGLRLVRRGPF